MPTRIIRPPFSASTAVLVLAWISLPLLLLPAAHETTRIAPSPFAMKVLHRTVAPGPLLDALCKDPATVTKPSRLDEAIQSNMKHALPDGLATRRLRPLPFIEVDTHTRLNGKINVRRFAGTDGTIAHLLPPQRRRPADRAPRLVTPMSIIEHDAKSMAYQPTTPPLPAACATNYPWSASVSVEYNPQGRVEHVFLVSPSKYRQVNEAILRSARNTVLTRAPGVTLNGEIQFRCLVGLQKQESQSAP